MPVDSTAIATSTLYPATPWIGVVLPSPTAMIYGTSHPDIWYHAASAQYESGLALKRHGCRILKMYWTDYHVDDDYRALRALAKRTGDSNGEPEGGFCTIVTVALGTSRPASFLHRAIDRLWTYPIQALRFP